MMWLKKQLRCFLNQTTCVRSTRSTRRLANNTRKLLLNLSENLCQKSVFVRRRSKNLQNNGQNEGDNAMVPDYIAKARTYMDKFSYSVCVLNFAEEAHRDENFSFYKEVLDTKKTTLVVLAPNQRAVELIMGLSEGPGEDLRFSHKEPCQFKEGSYTVAHPPYSDNSTIRTRCFERVELGKNFVRLEVRINFIPENEIEDSISRDVVIFVLEQWKPMKAIQPKPEIVSILQYLPIGPDTLFVCHGSSIEVECLILVHIFLHSVIPPAVGETTLLPSLSFEEAIELFKSAVGETTLLPSLSFEEAIELFKYMYPSLSCTIYMTHIDFVIYTTWDWLLSNENVKARLMQNSNYDWFMEVKEKDIEFFKQFPNHTWVSADLLDLSEQTIRHLKTVANLRFDHLE